MGNQMPLLRPALWLLQHLREYQRATVFWFGSIGSSKAGVDDAFSFGLCCTRPIFGLQTC